MNAVEAIKKHPNPGAFFYFSIQAFLRKRPLNPIPIF